jgi:plastocyanin
VPPAPAEPTRYVGPLAMARLGLIAISGLLLFGAGPAAGATKTFSHRFAVHVGPYQAVKESNLVRTPSMSGSIVRMSARVVDSKGRVVPQSQLMLHHLVFFDGGRPGATRHDNTCGTSRTPQRFFGTSEELRDLTMPDGYGYPIDRRDSWKSSWMVMNHTHRDRRAWIRYTVTIDDSKRIAPVEPYWVSIVPCGADPQYSVRGGRAEGSTDVRKRSWRVPHAGRIVAVGGHLHGGSRRLRLSQPRCGRTLVTSKPTYGPPDDPVYRVTPLLHEPDPLDITWWQSAAGIPVVKGEKLVVSADYDGRYPHMRVMGIDHVYIARDSKASQACEPLPQDAEELGADWTGRSSPPYVKLTLAEIGSDGYAHPIERPEGSTVRFDGPATVDERSYAYRPANISIPLGGRVRWAFNDPDEHDVTLNNGPVGFGGPWSRRGATYQRSFDVPGTYRLYCSLHPADMSQVVSVRSK